MIAECIILFFPMLYTLFPHSKKTKFIFRQPGLKPDKPLAPWLSWFLSSWPSLRAQLQTVPDLIMALSAVSRSVVFQPNWKGEDPHPGHHFSACWAPRWKSCLSINVSNFIGNFDFLQTSDLASLTHTCSLRHIDESSVLCRVKIRGSH